ncbi:sulfurtransferase [Asanoa siamensis]|uniref:thiosulfate sulfurtransferase n=1 Tax=Asanoa siamensis TaxID=926357 RepID=A0ABQ4CXB1_9ACTN|nr:rhodanese-like domain-containing protein [Asanoa siamensis]GIF75924.1 sulfurtransferase [Asanoa siamensis]
MSAVFVSAAALAASPRPPVVLHVGDGLGGRIPGAVTVDLAALQSPPSTVDGKRPLPSIEDLQASARSWGISRDSTVVVYDAVGGTRAGRAWWVLTWAGLADVRLLDGGLAAWSAAGRPVTDAAPAPVPGDVVLSPGHLRELDAERSAEYAAAGRLFDARGAEAFAAGHIPGAISVPTRDNLDHAGRLLPEPVLRARFAAFDIDGRRPVGLYCGGGVAAAHQAAVLASLGIETALFVGSFSAWSGDPDRPVSRTPVPEVTR